MHYGKRGRTILYSTWLALAAIAAVLVGFGIVRFLYDWKESDYMDIILLFFAGLLSVIVGLNAGSLDLVCTGGTFCVNGLETYTGQFYFFYLFVPAWLISWGLTIAATVVLLGRSFGNRSRGY